MDPFAHRLSRRAFIDRGIRGAIALSTGGMAAAALDGCAPSAQPSPSPTPAGAKVIRALVFDQVGYDAALLQSLADQFRRLHDDRFTVLIDRAQYRDLYETILDSGAARASSYDVVSVDQVWIPALAASRRLQTIAPYLDDAARADLLPNVIDAFSYRGAPFAMPQVLNVQSLYFNRAQLEAAGFDAAPASLEEWYEQMTTLKGRRTPYIDSWAEGEGLVSDFVRLSAQFGGDLFDAAGNPRLHDPAPQKAAAFMRRLIDEGLVGSDVSATSEPDAMRAFVDGEVAYTTNWNFVLGAMRDPAYSRIIGDGAVAPIPASSTVPRAAASVSGFLGLGVLRTSQDPELAFEWVRYLVSPEVQARQLTQLPIWSSLQTSPAFRKANPAIDTLLVNLANARPRPPLTRYVEASAVLQRHLHDLVVGASTASQALAQAQDELTTLTAH